jgi:hypothetical protein
MTPEYESKSITLLHLASRNQATLYALREGLASLEDADLSESGPDE